jgi:hypothetical protein
MSSSVIGVSVAPVMEEEARVFIHDHLDTFVKRDLLAFFAANPDAAFTLPNLERRLKRDRFILLGQLRGLRNAGLVAYHYQDLHTRVWHLAPTESARRMARAVVTYWAEHPENRHYIMHRGGHAK